MAMPNAAEPVVFRPNQSQGIESAHKDKKMFYLIKILPLMLLIAGSPVMAATVIELQSVPGGRSQVLMDDYHSRIDMGEQQDYVLIDHVKKTLLAIDPEQQQILDMSAGTAASARSSAPAIKIELVSQSSGPVIAGYTTREYKLIANGKTCGKYFASKAAMEISGISRLLESMKMMVDKQRAAMGAYARMIDVCTRAKMEFASQGDRVGVPMKMLDNRGNLVSEIVSINTQMTLPANTFTVPQGYKRVTLAEQMNSTGQGLRQAQRHMPDMKQMMQHRQQSGRMPPEAMRRW